MSQLSYNREVYNNKVEAFNLLRSGACALRGIKHRQVTVRSWEPATNKGTEDITEKKNILGRDVAGVVNYFDNKRSAALDVICQDKFTLHYQVYGDIDRQAVYGQNTTSIYHTVTWEVCDVEAMMYAGPLDISTPREKLATAAKEGIVDRSQIAKNTGWGLDAVRNLSNDKFGMLKELIATVKNGHSKLTRLVKGFLLMLESMEQANGKLILDIDIHDDFVYGVDEVIKAYETGGSAFVYNSKPDCEAHNAVIWTMCHEFPPTELQGHHVSIPADAPSIKMVCEGTLQNRQSRLHLTPELIYASITTYAMDTNCTGSLQQALIIACSLQQNRYWSKVELPTVVSTLDLMVPAFVRGNSRLDKPIVNRRMATSIGRLHQMLTFVNVKDLLSAAEYSTKPGFNPEQSMRAYLSSQSMLISQMAGQLSTLNLMEATLKMRFHNRLSTVDMGDIMNLSVLEGLWLCQDATKCVEGGVVSALLHGQSDLSNDRGTFDILCQEMDLGKISYIRDEIPKGCFSVGWVNTCGTEMKNVILNRPRTVRKVSLVQPCEFTPGSDFRAATKVRRAKNEQTRPPTATSVNQIFRPIPITKRRGPSSESVYRSPPSYRERSSTESSKPLSEEDVLALERRGIEIPEGKARIVRSAQPKSRPSTRSPSPQETGRPAHHRGLFDRQQIANIIAVQRRGLEDTTPGSREEVKQIVGDMSSQLTEHDQVEEQMAALGMKLSKNEKASLYGILRSAGVVEMFLECGNWDAFLSYAEQNQRFFNFMGHRMIGNSKHAKGINNLIDRGQPVGSMGSTLARMMTEKSGWSPRPGESIETAPAAGLRHIARSQVWRDFLENEGVIPHGEGLLRSGGSSESLAETVANVLSRYEGLTVKSVHAIGLWLGSSVSNHLPADITDDELAAIGRPELLDYRRHPSSFGNREFMEDDSKWLVMAARHPREVYKNEHDLLVKMCAVFNVPRGMRTALYEKYGLFDREHQQ